MSIYQIQYKIISHILHISVKRCPNIFMFVSSSYVFLQSEWVYDVLMWIIAMKKSFVFYFAYY
jgi:hypothetical protein